VTYEVPSRIGYDFLGWVDQSGETAMKVLTMLSEMATTSSMRNGVQRFTTLSTTLLADPLHQLKLLGRLGKVLQSVLLQLSLAITSTVGSMEQTLMLPALHM
jgi:hypothetical protein